MDDNNIMRFLSPRKETKKWLNDIHLKRIMKHIIIKKNRCPDSDLPCLIWNKKEKRARMSIHKERYDLGNFFYDYCVGDLGDGSRIVQLCPPDSICLQPGHIRPKKMTASTIPMTKHPLPFKLPKLDLMKRTEEDGKVLMDEKGCIFITMENLLKMAPQQIESDTNSDSDNE
jgi:hypothetical protein